MDNSFSYHYIVKNLRTFFEKKGFIEVPTQSRLSILAACEDPKTVTNFSIGGAKYPLPQTGQMWLEYELLNNPEFPGFFCITTSYRDEPNVIPGRHKRMFPLFEFESRGTVEDLKKMETELLQSLGFETPITVNYEDACQQYGCDSIEAEQEGILDKEISHAILLQNFPKRSNPYFNMMQNKQGTFNKVDVLLYGMETMGTAERSCDVDQMQDNFFTTSDGQYAQLLFDHFGKERVMRELNEFFKFDFFPRFGGGIGVTRLESAMKKAGLLETAKPFIATQNVFGHATI